MFTIWRLVREVKFAKYSHSYNVLITLDIEMFPTKVKQSHVKVLLQISTRGRPENGLNTHLAAS